MAAPFEQIMEEKVIVMESYLFSQLQVAGPELTNHTKKQFYSLMNSKYPVATHTHS